MTKTRRKINHHGKLSRYHCVKGCYSIQEKAIGVKEPTDNAPLAEKYLRLSYLSFFSAKDKTIDTTIITDFGQTIANIDSLFHVDMEEPW